MGQIRFTGISQFVFMILVSLFCCMPAEANLLPPQLTGYTSSSLTTARYQDAKLFRVDQASLTVQCQDDCQIEVEYIISSRRSAEVVLVFVLSQSVELDAAVNAESVPVTTTSALNLREHFIPESDVLMRLVVGLASPEERLQAASFKASLTAGLNTVRVNYKQAYNRDSFGYRSKTGYVPPIREFRYEFWPLQNWSLADSFTMTVNAEFAVRANGEEELWVYASGWPRSTSSVVEHFPSSDPTMTYQKEWKHNFPGRVLWFVGAKRLLETSKGFIPEQ